MMYSAKISHKSSTYTYDDKEISLIPDTRIEGQRNRGIEGQRWGIEGRERNKGIEERRTVVLFLYHYF